MKDRTSEGPSTNPSDDEVERLRGLVQSFVRRFGLLITNQTPCGHPISPSHAHALMALLDRSKRGDTTAQGDLVEILGIDKSNAARLAARMTEAGHVVQEAPEHDARSRHLRLTSSGSRLAGKIESSSHERFARLARRIHATERRSLFDSLERLNQAIGALEEGGES